MSNERLTFSTTQYELLNPKLMYLSYGEYGMDWRSNSHTHPFSEIIFVTGGSGTAIVDQQQIEISRGDLVIINPNVMHTEKSKNTDPLTYLILGIDRIQFLTLGHSAAEGFEAQNGFPPPKVVYKMSDKYDAILDLLKSIREELTAKTEYYETAAQNLLSLFIVLIMRNTSVIATHTTESKMSADCALIKRYIDSHFTYNFTLKELADKIFVNKYHLIHIFKKYIGMSPMNYILDKRIGEAKKLFENTDLNVSSVCKEVGFSNSNHFTQMFKKKEGMTPSQYRHSFMQTQRES